MKNQVAWLIFQVEACYIKFLKGKIVDFRKVFNVLVVSRAQVVNAADICFLRCEDVTEPASDEASATCNRYSLGLELILFQLFQQRFNVRVNNTVFQRSFSLPWMMRNGGIVQALPSMFLACLCPSEDHSLEV